MEYLICIKITFKDFKFKIEIYNTFKIPIYSKKNNLLLSTKGNRYDQNY